jgi:hypothetical protein
MSHGLAVPEGASFMPRKRLAVEQIIAKLREAEVFLSRGLQLFPLALRRSQLQEEYEVAEGLLSEFSGRLCEC